MSQDTLERAKKIVALFREDLAADIQAGVGEANFEKLTVMIYETIQEDRKELVSLIEELLAKLRKEIDIPDLGM